MNILELPRQTIHTGVSMTQKMVACIIIEQRRILLYVALCRIHVFAMSHACRARKKWYPTSMSYKKKSNKERIEFCDAGNNRCHYSTKDVYDCLDENGATQCETERRRTSSTVPCTSCQQNLHGMYTDGTGKTSPSSCKRYTCTSVFEQYNVAGAGTVVTHSYPLRNEPSCAQKCNIIDGCGGYDYTTSGKFWSSCKLYGQDFNKIKRKTYGIKFWTFCSKSTQAKTTPAPGQ